jgi:hypothetical protein
MAWNNNGLFSGDTENNDDEFDDFYGNNNIA